MGIKKDTKIQLELRAEEINTILDGLSALPYKQVFHIIAQIHEQVKAQNAPKALEQKGQ